MSEITSGQFVKTLKWIDGKPFCPCCDRPIEACHKCGEKTATEDIFEPEDMCQLCEEREEDICRVCEDCLRKP